MGSLDFTTPLIKNFDSGIDRGVIYTPSEYTQWFGIVELETKYTDTNQNVVYVDGMMNRVQTSFTGFEATCVCYHYPEEIEEGSFNFTYRVLTSPVDYELHLVYGCKAKMDNLQVFTLSSSPSIPHFSIELSTVPEYIPIKGYVPGSHLVIRSNLIWEEAIKKIEDTLYGTGTTDPHMPSIEDVVDLLEQYVSLRITDHGDGTWTAEELNTSGIIKMEDSTEFSIDWDSARYIDEQVYTIHSL